VLDEGESADSPRARAQAGPYAAIAFHNLVEQDQFGSIFPVGPHFPFQAQLDAYRKVYETYQPADARYLSNHRGHLMFVRPEETHVTADVIRGLTLTGTRAELVDRLKGMKAVGYSQIQFHMVPGQEDDMLERWADVMAKV
jgi:5,10-methylenetetrahydromethanopterin reductase